MKDKKNVKNLILSVITGLLIIVFSVFLFCYYITKKDIDTEKIDIIINIMCIAACLISGFTAGKRTTLKGLISGAVCSLIIIIIYYSTIFCANGFSVDTFTYISIFLSLIAGATGGIIASNMR